MRKASKREAGIHLIVWVVLLLISVVERISYQESTSTESLFSEGMYNVVILFAAEGVLTAALVLGVVIYFKALSSQARGRFDTILGYVANALCFFFYAFWISSFAVNRNWILLLGALWLLCAPVCLVMLVIAAIRRARQKRAKRKMKATD